MRDNTPDDDLDIILGGTSGASQPDLCNNGCGRALRPAPSAPHKRFCSDACRMQWHSKRRTEAMRLWESAQRAAPRAKGNQTSGSSNA